MFAFHHTGDFATVPVSLEQGICRKTPGILLLFPDEFCLEKTGMENNLSVLIKPAAWVFNVLWTI